jgi:hypothetical protein
VMCNSDGHKGRPGAEGPGAGQFGIANGSTCVLAESKTRRAIFDALKNRRCYGTTGARIDLDFDCEGAPMGSILQTTPNRPWHFSATVRGTAPIESLQLYRAKEVVQNIHPACFDSLQHSRHIRIRWRGSRIRGRGRRVNWDGLVRVQGPKILSVTGFFDTPVDGIKRHSATAVEFISQTTGDADGIDLVLDSADRGLVRFESKVGNCEVELADLTRKQFDFGGMDIAVTFERYPENPSETRAVLETDVIPPAGKTTPYFVKVTQCDGQMAWSSPIYLRCE